MSDTKLRTLRIPVGLERRLAEVARRSDRSVNGEILTAIRSHVERHESGEVREEVR